MKFNNNYICGKNVVLGKGVRIGDRTVIYDNVKIADNTTIANDCIIGEPLSDYYDNAQYKNPPTVIGSDSLIRSHTIIYAGSTFGNHLTTGHRAIIREEGRIGSHCQIGTMCDIQAKVTFGNYCRLHSNVHICQESILGNYIFVYPSVVLTNDPTPPSNVCHAPTIADYSVIATGSLIMPGIKVGLHCLVGAGSVVTRSVADFSLVRGVPAKKTGDIRDIKSRDTSSKHHYPWIHRFKRGMPWEKEGYDKWFAKQKKGEKITIS